MKQPKNATERAARQEWLYGKSVAAMRMLRDAGYDEAARVRFLRQVVGVTENALSELELHRDRYLDWLDEAEREDA